MTAIRRSAGYKVQVTAGKTLTWTTTDTDQPGYGLADGLTITRPAPNDDNLWPWPTTPLKASFAFLTPAAPDVDLYLDDLVTIKVWLDRTASTASVPSVSFYGRAKEIHANPTKQGLLVDVICADILADLGGVTVGAAGYAAQTAGERVTAVLNEAGWAYNWTSDPAVWANAPLVALPAGSGVNALTHLNEVLRDGSKYTLADVMYRWAAVPNVEDPAYPQQVDLYLQPSRHINYGVGLFNTVDGAGIIQLQPDPSRPENLDACAVEFDTEWVRAKYANAGNTIRMTSRAGADWTAYEATNRRAGEPRRALEWDSWMQSAAWASVYAPVWLPDPSNVRTWANEGLTYRLDLEAGNFPAIFPHYEASYGTVGQRTACYTSPILIFGIEPKRHMGSSHPWYAAVVSAATFRIKKRQLQIDFETAPFVPRPLPDASHVTQWQDFAAAPFTGKTWQQVNRPDSWYDYRLADPQTYP